MSSTTPPNADANQPQQTPPQYPPAQQYPPQLQQMPSGQPPQGDQPASGGDGKRIAIVIGAAAATAVLTVGLVFAFLAFRGDDDSDVSATATPSQTTAPTPSATVSASASPTAGKTFPKGYAVHGSDQFGFQKPSGWAVKADAKSTFFPDAPIIEAAQNNVAFWNDPTTHPSEQGFSVTDLTGTPTTPADFINTVSKTTQRPVCANVAGYATPFTRGDWVGLMLESGLCSDTNGRAILISATRQSDNAKIGLLIRGADPITATENLAMNAFDSFRD